MDDLERRFDREMFATYQEAKKLGYHASYFLRMLSELGGYKTAKHLINAASASEGFTKLWELGMLNISVEYCVLKPEYQSLFSDEERAICTDRLKRYGFRI